MKATMNSLLTLALFVASAVAQSFQINTPGNAVECQPTQITWSGGTPPYFLSILPGGQPSAPALEQFTGLTGTSFTWNTNIASGQSVGLTLRDSVGALAQSAPFIINPGTDSSCLTASPSSSASDTSAPSGSAPVGSSASTPGASSAPVTSPASTPVSTPAASTPATSRPASSGAPSSASRSSGSSSANPSATGGSSNGAVAQVASLGAAAVVGAAVAAILA